MTFENTCRNREGECHSALHSEFVLAYLRQPVVIYLPTFAPSFENKCGAEPSPLRSPASGRG